MIVTTTVGSSLFSARYAPAARPRPAKAKSPSGTAYAANLDDGAARGTSWPQRSRRSGPMALRLVAGRIVSTRAGYGAGRAPSCPCGAIRHPLPGYEERFVVARTVL